MEHEGCALPGLEIKGYGLQPTHVEEGLVLDLGDTWVVQVLAVHEASLLGEVPLVVHRVVVGAPRTSVVWLL